MSGRSCPAAAGRRRSPSGSSTVGLGFAAALGPLHLPPVGFAVALLGFNLGIEAVQILIAALFLAALLPFRSSAVYGRRVVPAGSTAASLLAGLWLVDRALGLSLAPF